MPKTKKRKKSRKPVAYEAILKTAESRLEASEQWNEPDNGHEWMANALHYMSEATALIELLEVHNCGSIGGFDSARGHSQQDGENYASLRSRLRWLKEMR